jgi:hypothetical protein
MSLNLSNTKSASAGKLKYDVMAERVQPGDMTAGFERFRSRSRGNVFFVTAVPQKMEGAVEPAQSRKNDDAKSKSFAEHDISSQHIFAACVDRGTFR